jgi:amino acid transporter
MRKATLPQMVFLIYGAACGGAFGLEGMISGSGPGLSLLILAVMPLLWSVPIALACAELGAAFPLEGGYYRWTRMAFGDFVGYLSGWWTWVGVFATNASFAVMFADYLGYWAPLPPWAKWAVGAALIWAVTWLNLRGIDVVGESSMWLTVVLLLPFALMTALGLLHWHYNPAAPFVAPGKPPLSAFGSGLMLAVWLYSGYDKLSTTANEVENPQRNFPLALAVAVPMVAASYLLPTLAGLAASGHWQDWQEKYFSTAAALVGGPWLGHFMTLSALISNFVLLNTTILSQSRLPSAMAADGLFPAFFARHHKKYGTPVASLVAGSLVLTLLAATSFTDLVTIYSVTQMAGYLLIYGALWRLRKTRADAPRPFKIGLGVPGLVLMALPSIAIALVAFAKADRPLLCVAAMLSGPLTFLVFARGRGRSSVSLVQDQVDATTP